MLECERAARVTKHLFALIGETLDPHLFWLHGGEELSMNGFQIN